VVDICDQPLEVEIETGGVRWRRAGAGGLVAHRDGAVDRDALVSALLGGPRPCTDVAEIRADDSLRYQALVTVMDAVIAAGFPDVGLTDEAPELALPAPPASSSAGGRPPTDRETLAKTPIIVIGAPGVRLQGRHIAGADAIDAIATYKALYNALLQQRATESPPGQAVVLQADQQVSIVAIRRASRTAIAAGYPHVLFAVKTTK